MITRVVAQHALNAEAQATAEKLAVSATGALGRARLLLLDSYSTSFETHLDAEARMIAESGRSPSGREGIAAFLQKRKPDFQS
jgi:2-(1,2-epoxy-1,2-dihydrophenyl)acetyl-CoA isomerase